MIMRIHVPLDMLGVGIFFMHSDYEELKHIQEKCYPEVDVSELKDAAGGVVGEIIWLPLDMEATSIPFLRSLVHETSHIVDEIMTHLGLEGTECRAYMMDYIVGYIISNLAEDTELCGEDEDGN